MSRRAALGTWPSMKYCSMRLRQAVRNQPSAVTVGRQPARPSAHEILLGGRKLVGSAQVRRAGALLQHGSIVIEPQIDTILGCLRLNPEAGGEVGRRRLETAVAGLAEVDDLDPARLAGSLA